MKSLISLLVVGLSLLLSGCDDDFTKATQENTNRATTFQSSMLIQFGNNMLAVHDCFLHAAGYARVSPTSNAIFKIGEPTGGEATCAVMGTALQTQANMLIAFSPFLGQSLMGRVPASTGEVITDLFKFGVKASMMKFGVEKVTGVITSGQAAQAQIAQAGIEAAAKPPLVIEVPTPPPAVE